VFDIIQLASPAIPSGLSASTIPNANFTMELLNYIQGEMKLEDLGQNKTRVKVSMSMLQGSTSDQKLLLLEKPSQILEKTLSTVQFSNEPTLEELTKFIASLKGIKMILHGPEKSVFAKHLTSCLASWNTDISHVPVLGCSLDDDDTHHGGVNTSSSINTAGSDSDASISTHTSAQSQSAAVASAVVNSPMVPENSNLLSALSPRTQTKIPSPAIEEDHIHSIPPAFILIDDDIVTLEKKLRKFRDQSVVPPPSTVQKRHRRSKSQQSGAGHSGTVAIVFFASLSNFKRVRDTIHWFGTGPQLPHMPRVIVVPKPAGPRRFLTALHTAWINAIVEPQFIPIATSPQSPFMNKPTNSSNLAGSPHLGDMNSLGGMMTPGGMATAPVNGAPTGGMTPHEISRFSPGRRTAGGPPTASVRTNPLHSPSASQAEAERGNYFFDPTNRPISSSSASPVSAGTPSTTRRKRSQSSARRTLLDISINGNTEQENASPAPVTESTQVQDNVETNTIPEASEQVIPAANVENAKKEEPEKPKSKFNFKISNRKRKDKTQSDKQSPPITVLIVEGN
jgi:osomolarity two-component system response regulator SSK1